MQRRPRHLPAGRRAAARQRQPHPGVRLALRTLVAVLVPLLGIGWLAEGGSLTPQPRLAAAAVAVPQREVARVVSRSTIRSEPVDRVLRRRVRVEAPVVQRYTDQLLEGEERVVAEGRDGIVVKRRRVTELDGRVVERRRLPQRVVREPQPRVVEVGTGQPPPEPEPEPEPQPEPERAEPAADAEPEPEPEPEPAKNEGHTQTGQASYYDAPGDGMTAAHRTLPFGTVVTVTNLANGKSVQVTITDRGPYIDGRVIDLNEPAFAEIANLSAGVVDVRVTW